MSQVATLIKELKDEVVGVKNDLANVQKGLEKVNYKSGVHAEPIDHEEEGKWGYPTFGHYCQAVRRSCGKAGGEHLAKLEGQLTKGLDAERERYGLQVTKTIQGNSETVDTEGNALIPPTYAQSIFERVYQNDLLSRLDSYTVGGRTMVFPRNAETSRVDGSRSGGVLAYWADEGQAVIATKPKWDPLTLTLRKLMVFGAMTSEMLEDTQMLSAGDYLQRKFADEVTFQIGAAVVRGTGRGMPLGLLNTDCVVSVPKEQGHAAASLVPQNLWKMYARMWAPSLNKAVWLINQDVWPALFSLKFDIGTAGVPVFMPPTGIEGAPYGTILGRPVLPVEFCSTLGTQGDVIFADLSQMIGLKKGDTPRTEMSMHLYFDSDQMAYRSIFRFDSNCWWKSAMTPYQGTKSQSPIIVLDTRS